MAKNIVILSDGTGQSYLKSESNVLRLYDLILKDPARQVACYNRGIATFPEPLGANPRKWARYLIEMCWGIGLMKDVTSMYVFLIEHHQPGDVIFLFGFSRGAFTVRALAALVHVCGLLRPENLHLVPDALELFQSSENRIRHAMKDRPSEAKFREDGRIDHARFDSVSSKFKERFSRDCKIDFMGIWDTVKAYGVIWPKSFPCLRHNPSVLTVRHAVALDERRSLFQMTGWGDRDDRTGSVKEVWFHGDHSDVGGGHDGGNSLLTDITLRWMVGEAANAVSPKRLLLDGQPCSRDFLDHGGEETLPHANNLDQGIQWLLSRIPRFELDNQDYPPARPLNFRPSGVREPSIHTECARLRYHRSVQGVPGPDKEETLKIDWTAQAG